MKDYSDIIDHPHHVSRTHPQMSMHDRAAQFSPFAALTGFEFAAGIPGTLGGSSGGRGKSHRQAYGTRGG